MEQGEVIQLSELPPQFVEISTPRFFLRTLQPGDAGSDLEAWTLDPIMAEMMNAELKTWAIERQRRFFTEGLARPDRRMIGIFPRDTGRPIGLFIIRLNTANRTFVISTLIGDRAWRGKDVAGECADKIYRMMFIDAGFSKAKANVLPANKAMIWLLSSTWRREGRLHRHLRNAETGERMDVLVYGLLKKDWLDYIRCKEEKEAAEGMRT
jgi:RimJ/RimL family protein N-acetyltransferase